MTEIKKITPGTYGYMVVTRKGWGVFVNGVLKATSDTKTGAQYRLEHLRDWYRKFEGIEI